jgi:hypothetical protein
MFPDGTLVRLVKAANGSNRHFRAAVEQRTVFRVAESSKDQALFYSADGTDVGNGFTYWSCDEPWTRHTWERVGISCKEDIEALYADIH